MKNTKINNNDNDSSNMNVDNDIDNDINELDNLKRRVQEQMKRAYFDIVRLRNWF